MRVLLSILITIIIICGCSKSTNSTNTTPSTNPSNATGTFTFTVNGVNTSMVIARYYLLQDGYTISFTGTNNFTGYGATCTIKMPTVNKVSLGQYSSAQNLSSFGYNHDYVLNGITYINEWSSSTISIVVLNVVSYDASNHYNIQITFSGIITDLNNKSCSIN